MNSHCASANFTYRLKKKWFGFWQKYKLKNQLKISSKLFILFLIVWLIASVLTILSQWAGADTSRGALFQSKYLKYFWTVIIELISGFDVPEDELKLNVASQILTVAVLITGVIILAIFTGQVVSMFIHVRQRMNHLPEKPENFPFNRPIVICGINNKLYKIIEELRKSCLTQEREIVIIDSNADQLKTNDKELFKDVWYVKGNQADRSMLEKAVGAEQTSAIILASSPENRIYGRNNDSRAIETAMAVEGYKEKIHTVLELIDERNIPHLRHSKINEWISISEYGIRLTSQAVLQHGMGSVYHYLLGGSSATGKTNQIYFSANKLPASFAGQSYKNIRDKIVSEPGIDIMLIGFDRYVPLSLINKLNLNIGNSFFIKQLNPVSRRCKLCCCSIGDTDELGRIQKKCQNCFITEKKKNKHVSNPWYFPIDTILNIDDRLIYLAEKPVDFDEIFIKKKIKRKA